MGPALERKALAFNPVRPPSLHGAQAHGWRGQRPGTWADFGKQNKQSSRSD